MHIFILQWDELVYWKWQMKRGGRLSKELQYFCLCNNLDQTDTWAESQKPCGGKSPALQNQRDSSFRFYYATEKQKRQLRVGSANTFTVATKPKQPQYWWFKSSGQWRLNKHHQWCHNGATRCTSPWQNKLPSTLIPPPVSDPLVLPVLLGVLVKENVSL